MSVGCNRGVVVIHKEEIPEAVTSDGIQSMGFRMMELSFAADLMRFLMAVMHDGDFAAERVINVISSGG